MNSGPDGTATRRGLSPQQLMGGTIRESSGYFVPVQPSKQGHRRYVGDSSLCVYHLVDEGGCPYANRERSGKQR